MMIKYKKSYDIHRKRVLEERRLRWPLSILPQWKMLRYVFCLTVLIVLIHQEKFCISLNLFDAFHSFEYFS